MAPKQKAKPLFFSRGFARPDCCGIGRTVFYLREWVQVETHLTRIIAFLLLENTFHAKDDFSENRCADKTTRRNAKRHRDNLPRKTLESFQVFTNAETCVSKNRGCGRQEAHMLNLGEHPVAARESWNGDNNRNQRNPEDRRELRESRQVSNNATDEGDNEQNQGTDRARNNSPLKPIILAMTVKIAVTRRINPMSFNFANMFNSPYFLAGRTSPVTFS